MDRITRSLQELDRAIKDFPSASELGYSAQLNEVKRGELNIAGGTGAQTNLHPDNTIDIRLKLQRIRARSKVLAVQLGIPRHSLKNLMDSVANVEDGMDLTRLESTSENPPTKLGSNEW